MNKKNVITLMLTMMMVMLTNEMLMVAGANPLQLVKLEDNASLGVSGAYCNDGSAAAFYWRAGSSRQYIVHLQGGYWCWDEASCLARAQSSPELTSSNSYAAQAPSWLGSSGIFDPDSSKNPVWSSANVAYVMYCSSDAFSGNGSAPIGNSSWYFHGQQILRSTLALLINSPQFGRLTFKDPILLSGCSAGAQGVINSADYVREVLPQLLGGQAPLKYQAMADAGWMMSPQPANSAIEPIIEEFVSAAPLWGGSPNGNCVRSNGANALPLCYLSQFAWPHMLTPVFIQSSQYDAFQVPYNAGQGPPYSGSAAAYVQSIRSLFNYSMQIVKPPSAIFSPSCYYHCISEDDNFYTMQIPDAQGIPRSMNNTLSAWYHAADPLQSYSLQSECLEFNCGVGCPPVNS